MSKKRIIFISKGKPHMINTFFPYLVTQSSYRHFRTQELWIIPRETFLTSRPWCVGMSINVSGWWYHAQWLFTHFLPHPKITGHCSRVLTPPTRASVVNRTIYRLHCVSSVLVVAQLHNTHLGVARSALPESRSIVTRRTTRAAGTHRFSFPFAHIVCFFVSFLLFRVRSRQHKYPAGRGLFS